MTRLKITWLGLKAAPTFGCSRLTATKGVVGGIIGGIISGVIGPWFSLLRCILLARGQYHGYAPGIWDAVLLLAVM